MCGGFILCYFLFFFSSAVPMLLFLPPVHLRTVRARAHVRALLGSSQIHARLCATLRLAA
jgi:hypothetical protein